MSLLEKVLDYLDENSRFFREYRSYTCSYGNSCGKDRVWRWRPFDRVVDAFIEWKRLMVNDEDYSNWHFWMALNDWREHDEMEYFSCYPHDQNY